MWWVPIAAAVAPYVMKAGSQLLDGAKNLVANNDAGNNVRVVHDHCDDCDRDADCRFDRGVRDHRSRGGELYDALDSLDRKMQAKMDKLEKLMKDPEKNQGELIKVQNEISIINRAYEAISNIFKGMNDVDKTAIRNFN